MSASSKVEARFKGRFGGFLLDITFDAPASGVTALFGPSGCGKTSVLRCIAGLQQAEGYFAVGDDVWQDGHSFRPPHRRPVGYVFQEASLFPHLSVERNLLFGKARAARGAGSSSIGLGEVVTLLGLSGLLGRSPRNLSGGERQRVAIGRALLSQPSVLLMDEPLSALDRHTKDEILPFLERLHDALSIPVVYVSHDMAEVERLADHLVLMDAGRVVASGHLEDLQSDPRLPLMRGRDAAATLHATTVSYDSVYELLTLEVAGAQLVVPGAAAPPGEPRRLRILAGDVSLTTVRPMASSISNILQARILEVAKVGPAELAMVLGLGESGDGARILARVTRRSRDLLGLGVGSTVFAQVKGVALVQGSRSSITEVPSR